MPSLLVAEAWKASMPLESKGPQGLEELGLLETGGALHRIAERERARGENVDVRRK